MTSPMPDLGALLAQAQQMQQSMVQAQQDVESMQATGTSGGGIQATGNHPSRARTPDELLYRAAWLVFFAMVFDALDGLRRRRTARGSGGPGSAADRAFDGVQACPTSDSSQNLAMRRPCSASSRSRRGRRDRGRSR